jgi:hypothetical protein
MNELAHRVEALEKDVKSVKDDTTELLEIFRGAKVAATFFIRLGRWFKWLGGIAAAAIAIYKFFHFIKDGQV